MVTNVVLIEDRDKEYKKCKSHVPEGLMFDGITNCSRQYYLKFINRVEEIFTMQDEKNTEKSGDWNYVNLIRPTIGEHFKLLPFNDVPDSSDTQNRRLYSRIESLSACGKQIISSLITEDAKLIFDEGWEDICPPKHKYGKLLYGMRNLYKKYCAKTLPFAIELRSLFNC